MITARTGELSAKIEALSATVARESELTRSAFEQLKASVESTVKSGMEQRSDEILLAISRPFSANKLYTISAANIPHGTEIGKMWLAAAEPLGAVRYTVIGDKGIMEVDFGDMLGEKAAHLQRLIEMSKDKSVTISIGIKYEEK